MNIQEIRTITKQVKEKRAAAGRKAAATAKENEKKKRLEMIENAKDVSFFMEEIEATAKKGKNTYSISLGGDKDDPGTRLEMKYIKKKLADFNPTFTRDEHTTCSYNYDGDSIDGTDRMYHAMTVHFNW